MDFQNLLVKIAEILSKLNIPYAVTGGYAVSVWGRPRSTFDVDVIVQLLEPEAKRLAEALKKISEMSYVDEEMVLRAVERKGEFNFVHIESGIKVDFWVIKKNDFSQGQLRRRLPKKILGKMVYFISPEDLILNKLLWYKQSESSRQLEDVESILKISGSKLDKKYLARWTEKLNISSVWRRFKV